MSRLSRPAKRQAGAERIERFEHAGQTVAQFCAVEAVSTASFYQWRRKLRSDAPVASQGQTRSEALAQFIPVELLTSQPAPPATVMSVELPGGVRVRLEVASDGTAP